MMTIEHVSIRSSEWVNTNIVKGHWYEDGWLGQMCEMVVEPTRNVSTIYFNFWNPDFAMCYQGNRISVTIDKVSFISPELSMGQNIEFQMEANLIASVRSNIAISSSAYCLATAMDQREKSVIVSDRLFFSD